MPADPSREPTVRSFFEWFHSAVSDDTPWLILGKGPSFALRHQHRLAAYHTLGLNHVVREQPVLVAHAIDLDVVTACADAIEGRARYLAMPWYPHIENRPGTRPLDQLVDEHGVLGRLSAAGRLLWYDLSTSPIRHGAGPTVEATYFSAEAALSLLALAGARTIRTLGVDGGATYSSDFRDLLDRTLLRNGNPHFDLQFEGFARTICRTDVDFAALNLPAPVRVYVAHSEAESLPVSVLRHAIRKRASLTIEVEPVPIDGPYRSVAATRGLILAPGALVQSDVRKVWTLPCDEDEMRVWLDPRTREVAMVVAGGLPLGRVAELARAVREGASLERVRTLAPPGTRVVAADPERRREESGPGVMSYSPDGGEPWSSSAHPVGHLWVAELLDAVASGAITRDQIAEAVRCRQVRPSLLHQVDHGLVEPLLVPRPVRLLDRGFHPTGGRAAPPGAWWARRLGKLRALARELGRRVHEYRVARGTRVHAAAERARAAGERGGAPA